MPGPLRKPQKKPQKKRNTQPDKGHLAQAWRLYKASTLRMLGKEEGAKKLEKEWESMNPKSIAARKRIKRALSPPVRK